MQSVGVRMLISIWRFFEHLITLHAMSWNELIKQSLPIVAIVGLTAISILIAEGTSLLLRYPRPCSSPRSGKGAGPRMGRGRERPASGFGLMLLGKVAVPPTLWLALPRLSSALPPT
jgi:hypothetical protein